MSSWVNSGAVEKEAACPLPVRLRDFWWCLFAHLFPRGRNLSPHVRFLQMIRNASHSNPILTSNHQFSIWFMGNPTLPIWFAFLFAWWKQPSLLDEHGFSQELTLKVMVLPAGIPPRKYSPTLLLFPTVVLITLLHQLISNSFLQGSYTFHSDFYLKSYKVWIDGI